MPLLPGGDNLPATGAIILKGRRQMRRLACAGLLWHRGCKTRSGEGTQMIGIIVAVAGTLLLIHAGTGARVRRQPAAQPVRNTPRR